MQVASTRTAAPLAFDAEDELVLFHAGECDEGDAAANEEAQREADAEVWSNMEDFGRDSETGWSYSDEDDPPW